MGRKVKGERGKCESYLMWGAVLSPIVLLCGDGIGFFWLLVLWMIVGFLAINAYLDYTFRCKHDPLQVRRISEREFREMNLPYWIFTKEQLGLDGMEKYIGSAAVDQFIEREIKIRNMLQFEKPDYFTFECSPDIKHYGTIRYKEKYEFELVDSHTCSRTLLSKPIYVDLDMCKQANISVWDTGNKQFPVFTMYYDMRDPMKIIYERNEYVMKQYDICQRITIEKRVKAQEEDRLGYR